MSEQKTPTAPKRSVRRVKVDPADIEISSVRIYRQPEDEYDQLRGFRADIERFDAGTVIGDINGMLCLHPDESLEDAGDCIDDDWWELCAVAQRIITRAEKVRGRVVPESVVLIGCLRLGEKWRGNRLAGTIVNQLLDVLQLMPEWCLVVLRPEPLTDDGPMPDGPERDAALAALCGTYKAAGFKRWPDSRVWYRPVTG